MRASSLCYNLHLQFRSNHKVTYSYRGDVGISLHLPIVETTGSLNLNKVNSQQPNLLGFLAVTELPDLAA